MLARGVWRRRLARNYASKKASGQENVPEPANNGSVPAGGDAGTPAGGPRRSAAPAAMDPSLKSLMRAPKVEYDPRAITPSTSYAYEAPKSPGALYREEIANRARGPSKFRKLLPSILLSLGACWGMFAYQYLTHDMDPDVDTDSALLRADKFLPWIVSFKYQIDQDHYLIELTRRNRAQKLIHNQELFNGSRLWSVEAMQPDINIVRNYTPLPLYVAGVDPYKGTPLLRLVSELEHEGKFVLIVKRYEDGEFARWLTDRDLLDEVRLRGPIEEFKFPFHPLDRYEERPQMANAMEKVGTDPEWPGNVPAPENFAFFGAGTGIMPLFQMALSKNPPKGFADVHYSLRSEGELLPQLKTLAFFLEQCGRAKFHYYVDPLRIAQENVPQPTLPNYTGGSDLRISEEIFREKLKREKRAEVEAQVSANAASATNNTLGATPTSENNFKKDEPALDIIALPGIDTIPLTDARIKPENAYQGRILSRLLNIYKRTQDAPPAPSLALVCGPEGYVSTLSGRPDRNNLEGIDKAPLGGTLKARGWDDSNVARLP